MPDYDLFNKRNGQIVRVCPGVTVPEDYRTWSEAQRLTPIDFWLYALAAGNHSDYWTEGTAAASQLANRQVDIPTATDVKNIAALVSIGERLVTLWSLDTVDLAAKNAQPTEGSPGKWTFTDHSTAEKIVVHGRGVLKDWRRDRPEPWSKEVAIEYGRSVAALIEIRELGNEIAALLGPVT